MRAVLALAAKDLKLLVRDRFALFWILAFPLMFALFFGALFGDDDGGRGALPVVVVDEDGSDASRALADALADSAALRVERGAADAATPLPALERARTAVQKGDRVAYLRIPAGYGANPWALFGAGGDERPRLELGIDPGRRAEAGLLQGVVMQASFAALQARFGDRELLRADLAGARESLDGSDGMDAGQKAVLQGFLGALDTFVGSFDLDALADGTSGAGGGFGPSLELVDVSRDRTGKPRSTWDITFPQAFVWGLMSVAMGFAITLARERASGTLLRLRMAPVRRAQLLAGKGVACFAACLGTMALLLAIGVVAMGMRPDRPDLLALAMACTAACFTGLMMVSSVLGKSESAVAGASWGLMMPLAMIGGGMIPLIAMPRWLVTASAVSPFKWAILAVEGALWRGFSAADMALPCAILLGTGAALFAVGVLLFRKLDG